MGIGLSVSTSVSEQQANAQTLQNYSGTCDISCDNTIDNASITAVNSSVGGDIGISQICAVNGQCAFNTQQSALTDIKFKAANFSTAADTGWGIHLDISTSYSYQQINESINQQINQKCAVNSSNSMNNVSVYAANSKIGGSVGISQVGSSTGGCTLQAAMSANALASGTANTCAAGGKSKKVKKSCGGKSGKSIGTFLLYGAIAMVVFVVVMMIFRAFKGGNPPLPPCGPYLPPGVPCKPQGPPGSLKPAGMQSLGSQQSLQQGSVVRSPINIPNEVAVAKAQGYQNTPPQWG